MKYFWWRMRQFDSGRPPHGGRGLKCAEVRFDEQHAKSPPARGAWIEISTRTVWRSVLSVAPRTGGVD